MKSGYEFFGETTGHTIHVIAFAGASALK